MPFNDHVTSTCTEKLMNPSIATSPTPMSSSASAPVKVNSQMSLQMLLNQNSNSSSTNSSSKGSELIQHQGQKWDQVLDFEKLLKTIRISEKQHLRDNKYCDNNAAGNNSRNSLQMNNAVSPGKTQTSPSLASSSTCDDYSSDQIKQVQRLNGNEMHYYGIVPKQTAVHVVVCNVCRGIYTKVGFNNHMMLQHPSIWSSIPNKINLASLKEAVTSSALAISDNSQDSLRETNNVEVDVSSSDMSGTVSTCSNVSTSSSMVSSATGSTNNSSRHKGTKNKSFVASSSGIISSNSGGRSRGKSKHHSSSSTIVHAALSPITDSSQTILSKGSKKLSAVNISAPDAVTSTVVNPKETNNSSSVTVCGILDAQPSSLTAYSSSSNSSCSLPSTPKTVNASSEGMNENNYSPAHLLSANDAKDKLVTADNCALPTKKKENSPSVGSETVDSSTSSSSSSEFERSSSNGRISSHSKTAANEAYYNNNNNNNSVSNSSITNPANVVYEKDLHHYNTHVSELDQAVSSITSPGQVDDKNDVSKCVECNENTSTAATPIAFKIQSNDKIERNNTSTPSTNAEPNANYEKQKITIKATRDMQVAPNSSGDTLFTLEDVLDSKFINEILSSADTDMHFDENELENDTQQQRGPLAKRMRYNEASAVNQLPQQHPAPEIPTKYAVFQQQQQQFTHYNMGDNENKIFNTAADTTRTDEQQYPTQTPQITQIDAIQLQQLLYHQQNLNTYGHGVDGLSETTSTELRNPQFDQSTELVNAKNLLNLCATEQSLQKTEDDKLTEYTTLTTLNNVYEDSAIMAQFQIYNIPSLTDDPFPNESMEVDQDIIVPNLVENLRSGQQYVLPGTELIYEITDNNQVAVMSQQHQHQVISEFLTQAGYAQNIENINTTNNDIVTPYSTEECYWEDCNELLDFDFSLIETIKSLGANTASRFNTNEHTGAVMVSKPNQDDFYCNVFVYAGIPRPLTINNFGLIKLPQACSTTFKKNLMTARKANNSPVTLSGCINSMVGTNAGVASSSAARFGNVTAKPVQTYFTSLGSAGASNSNEFSIGSITITNSPSLSQHQSFTQQQKQQSPVELTFNATPSSPGTSNIPRMRSKSNLSSLSSSITAGNASSICSLVKGSNKASLASASVSTPGGTGATRVNVLPQQPTKTIYINCATTTANSNMDRIKCIKRSLISKFEAEKKPQQISTKHIAEVLGFSANTIGSRCNITNKQALVDNRERDRDIDESQQQQEPTQEYQLKLNRINNFYARRKKLVSA